MPTYTLTNVEDRHRQYPRDFWIPTANERKAVRPGDMVKLIFAGRERMWVEVKEVKDSRYAGRLSNRPFNPDALGGLKYGDRVEFGPEHISDICKGQT